MKLFPQRRLISQSLYGRDISTLQESLRMLYSPSPSCEFDLSHFSIEVKVASALEGLKVDDFRFGDVGFIRLSPY